MTALPKYVDDCGFRSVSLLFNDGCLVVKADDSAPALLIEDLGQVKTR